MEIRADKIARFFPFFFHDHDRNFSEVLHEANKPSDLKGPVLSIEEKRELSVGRSKGREGRYFSSVPIDEDNGIGS